MPKFLDNYRLQPVENLKSDKMEHYVAKQQESNKYFILKRFNTDLLKNSSSQPNTSFSESANEFFQKLTNQTLILKMLQHKSIPKCVRILKTNNSIYFVFENHPFTSLKQYLQRSWVKVEQKIQISITIIETLKYIHSKNVLYRGLKIENIKADHRGNIYFTNFKNSMFLGKNEHPQDDNHKKQKDFTSVLSEDVYDAGKAIFQIFEFNKVDPKYYYFSSDLEKKIYELVCCILQKRQQSSHQHLNTLLKNLSQKQSIRTACTSNTENALSAKSRKRNSAVISSKYKNSDSFQSQLSISKFNIESPAKKNLHSITLGGVSQERISRLTSSIQKKPSSKLLVQKKYSNQMTERIPKSLQKDQNKQLQEITNRRKIIFLIFYCIRSLAKSKSFKIMFMLLIKCEELSDGIKKNISNCMEEFLYDSKKEFLKIVKNQNIKTIAEINKLKQAIKEYAKADQQSNRKHYEEIEEFNRKRDLSLIQSKLSQQIFRFLQKETISVSSNDLATSNNIDLMCNIKSRQKTNSSEYQNAYSRISYHSKGNSEKDEENYQKLKVCYYLSTKIKYGSFEKFFEKKNNFQSIDVNLMKNEYFQTFESKTIPADELLQEIMQRIQKYSKKVNTR